jgi:hypothetical protein
MIRGTAVPSPVITPPAHFGKEIFIMTLTEKTAYLKGLMDGMNLNKEDNTGKLLAAIIETLDEMALTVEDLDDTMDSVCDELEMIEEAIDEIDEDMEAVDEDLDTICDIMDECGLIDEDECDGDCQSCDLECDLEDEDEDEEGEPWDGEEEFYQLSCPTCGEELVIDMEVLEKGEMKCPACGEELEFDTSALYEDEVKNPIEVK